jgi:hypothetical protein
MTTDSAVDARADARARIERALVPRDGHGGLAAAFDVLETKLRQPYARALTDEDRQAIKAFVNNRVDELFAAINRLEPGTLWSVAEGPEQ